MRGEYCAFGFERQFEDQVLTFQVHSEQPFQIRDNQSGTIWNESGQAIEGPFQDRRLRPASGYVTEWYEWSTQLPVTEIYSKRLKSRSKRSNSELAATAESILKQGLLLKEQWQFTEAIRQFRKALQIQPDLVLAHFNLGFVLALQNKLPDAAESFQRTLELQPEFTEAHIRLARVLEKMNDPAEARAHYERTIEIDPDFEDGHLGLGMLFAQEGKLPEAVQAIERALEIRPVDETKHLMLVKILLKQVQLDQAAKHGRQALEIEPDHLAAQLSLGRIELQRGKLTAAVDLFRKSLAINDELADVANILAWTLATSDDGALGKLVEAVQWAQRAAQLTQHQNPEILDTLAAAYAHVGRYDEAFQTAEKTILLARSANQPQSVTEIQERLDLYRQRQPYREEQ